MARQFTETRKTIHKSFFFFKFSKEIETVEKIQTEILKLKNTMNEMKISKTESINVRMDQAEERIYKLENHILKIIHSEEKKEKRLKKNE